MWVQADGPLGERRQFRNQFRHVAAWRRRRVAAHPMYPYLVELLEKFLLAGAALPVALVSNGHAAQVVLETQELTALVASLFQPVRIDEAMGVVEGMIQDVALERLFGVHGGSTANRAVILSPFPSSSRNGRAI